jgi:hypothetical protein
VVRHPIPKEPAFRPPFPRVSFLPTERNIAPAHQIDAGERTGAVTTDVCDADRE